jgi:hypothetical protein
MACRHTMHQRQVRKAPGCYWLLLWSTQTATQLLAATLVYPDRYTAAIANLNHHATRCVPLAEDPDALYSLLSKNRFYAAVTSCTAYMWTG